MATNGHFAQQEQYKATEQQATSGGSDRSATNSNLTKDEVGWYFVEQYYTTLSKSPEKLHLFYGKRSQFVYGLEAEVANVSVGRQAIQERIKALDFQDCKVRVSNVDSQASYDNIVIQVIGETSNKGAEPKKFVQTFVLAQQPSGYFVLNDMLRYINEEEDEETAEPIDTPTDLPEPAPTAAEPESVQETAKPESKLDADAVDEKLNQSAAATATAATAAVAEKEVPVNGDDAAETETPKASETKPEPVAAAPQEIIEESPAEPEKPKEPSPTPAAKPKQEAAVAATAPEPIMPPKPMTWASRAAAAAGPRPVVPLPKTATPPAQNQTRAPAPPAAATTTAVAAAPPSAAAPAATTQSAAATASTTEPASKESSGWQTAGADSKRQNRPQSISATATDKEGTLGYVKFVSDKVQDAELRSALAAHGELAYFDINRQKNCAFVEYKTIEGYQAAIAANPHVVNGVDIVVEPRRPKSNAYGGNSYNTGRGNAPGGRGRGGFDGNRNSQGNQRGSFSGQNRGRGGAARTRGGAQANNA
ncbi:hypothetical protein QQS21_011662 [Conoideocrella luteorostrata]|uniref:NTF2 domain-containing protein n=1 Tax=Conoideocrella luteorostrata TaxID=1105319 RepID=A0AAJ0CFH0_9HYPO|nr:hypothetical protein QQS21_011662 [Conoideocrella luteorostrata]